MGGGVIPVSVVLADRDVMLCIQPGEHGRFVVIPINLRLMVSLPSLDNLSSKKLGGFSFMLCVTVSLQFCLHCLKCLFDLCANCFVLQKLTALLLMFVLSTFGGNPLASAVAIASLDVIQEEKLAQRY